MADATKPKVDVKALASLARLSVTDAELENLEKKIPDILAFVETIQKAVGSAPKTLPSVRNVFREDANPHESGMYTQALLAQAPAKSGDYFMVKQIIRNKKQKAA